MKNLLNPSKFSISGMHKDLQDRNKEIKDKLMKTVIPKSDFNRPIASMIGKIFDKFVIPHIRSRFEKYTEAQFHERCVKGFDFLQDMKDNHPDTYRTCILFVRPVRNSIIINRDAIYNALLDIFAQYGWTVTDMEKETLMRDVTQLVHELYTR